MTQLSNPTPIGIFSEIIAIDHRIRGRLGRALPKGMELSHWSVLNLLAIVKEERTPAQIAKALNVSRGAMTNTLNKLEQKGYVHVRGDWDDARKKWVAISDAGKMQRDMALESAAPVFDEALSFTNEEEQRKILNLLRQLRLNLD